MTSGVGLGADGKPRCSWCLGDDLYMAYHDEEWGGPMRDDAQLFGLLMLEGFQAGLSWRTILHKRQHFHEAFDGWDPERIAAYTDEDIARLMANPGIVRNRLKCEGAVRNAQAYLRLRDEIGSFSDHLWSFVGGAADPPLPDDRLERAPGNDPGIGRDVEGLAQARLHLRRQHHLLRLHAGGGHGRRPHGGMLSWQLRVKEKFPVSRF